MTVSSTDIRISYSGNGVTTAFSYPYYFLSSSDLKVYARSSAGVETLLALGSDYTVSGAANPGGGTVTMLTAPATGVTLIIFRDPAITQTTDYVDGDPFGAATSENALDKRTMVEQRLNDLSLRSLRLHETDSIGNGSFNASGQRIGNVLAGSVAGDAVTFDQIASLNAATPVEFFSTRAAAVAATISGGTTWLRTQGYYLVGDGGEALYKKVLGSTTGGFQSADGAWWQLAEQELNVRMFGAKGDGATDDTTAITSAISVANAIGSALAIPASVGPSIPVFFDAGSYVCGDVILLDFVSLRGRSHYRTNPEAKILYKAGALTVFGSNVAVGDADICGFMFLGPNTGAGTDTCIHLAEANRCNISDNFMVNFSAEGILIGAGVASVVSGNLLERCLQNAAAFAAQTGALNIAGTDHWISDNEIGCSRANITSANLYCAAYYIQCSTSVLRDNVGEFSDAGFVVDGQWNNCVNNRSDHNPGPGWVINGSRNSFCNCYSLSDSLQGAGTYSGFLTTGGNNLFSNCFADGSVVVALKFGFEDTHIGDFGKNSYVNCQALGQVVFSTSGVSGSAVQVLSGPLKSFTDLDTTPSVDNYADWRVSYSAPTTITNLDNGLDGQKVLLYFTNANASIGHGGGINTPTSATVNFTAGQILQLYNNAGTWRFATNNP